MDSLVRPIRLWDGTGHQDLEVYLRVGQGPLRILRILSHPSHGTLRQDSHKDLGAYLGYERIARTVPIIQWDCRTGQDRTPGPDMVIYLRMECVSIPWTVPSIQLNCMTKC